MGSTTAAPGAGRDGGEPLDGADLPPAVTAALAQELSAPGADARLLLQGAAVAGDPFDPDLAGAAAELDRGCRAGRARRAPGARPRAAREHPAALSLPPSAAAPGRVRRRAERLAHRRAQRTSDALAARGAGATARAHHVEQSAKVGDLDAVALLSQAGADAARRAPASAARWFSAALRAAARRGRPSKQRIGLLVALAESLVAIGRLEDGRAVILELLAVLPARIPPRCASSSSARAPRSSTCSGAIVRRTTGCDPSSPACPITARPPRSSS